MNKRIMIVGIFLIGILCIGNIFWFGMYQEQRRRVKNSLIPTLTNDYYSNQLVLTKYVSDNYYGEMAIDMSYYDEKKQKVYDVPLVYQMPKYPNGCEVASAAMLLNYYGIDISIDELMEYLPKKSVIEQDGTRYGPNPAEFYAGEPTDANNGWGCFDLVLVQVFESVLHSKNLSFAMQIMNSKLPLGKLEFPSIIWVTTDYEEADEVFTWQNFAKSETYTMPRNMHVVVLTGYDEENYYINDPLKGEKNIPVSKEKLEKCYDSLGRQHISLVFNEDDGFYEVSN